MIPSCNALAALSSSVIVIRPSVLKLLTHDHKQCSPCNHAPRDESNNSATSFFSFELLPVDASRILERIRFKLTPTESSESLVNDRAFKSCK